MKNKVLIFPVILISLFLVLLRFGVLPGKANDTTQVTGSQEYGTDQIGPAWFDLNWHYRQPIVITNNSTETLTNYQVLIALNGDNFDFSNAEANGKDVRFTQSDGVTLIDYWIEGSSWDKTGQSAYVWVEIPTLAPGNTTIYLYYSNSSASPVGNGKNTFIFFDDDWDQFNTGGQGCYASQPWGCRGGQPTVSLGNLVLIASTGITSHDTFLYKAVGYRANYGSGNGNKLGGFFGIGPRTVIKDLSTDPDDLYLENYVGTPDQKILSQVGGLDWHDAFHTFEVEWSSGQSIGEIDHGAAIAISSQPLDVPSGILPVTFDNISTLNTSLLVDWVYVRNYVSPEPTVSYGKAQGLVDLKVQMVDSPDPLYAGEAVSYQITITNISGIAAPGVVVTDLLPVEVDLLNTVASQGTCDSQVVCDLGTIQAGMQASVTVVVGTTIDGSINNSVSVSTQAYDANLLDNTAQESTTVKPSADLAISLNSSQAVYKPGDLVTYNLTLSNNGPSIAKLPAVALDLPPEMTFQVASPNICVGNGLVTCNIEQDLVSGGSSQVLVIVKILPTLTNTQSLDVSATVSSVTHDPVAGNDNSIASILVDAEKPVVAWIYPAQNSQIYRTYKSRIPLIAEASDNVAVSQVKFAYWDHNKGVYNSIGIASTPPYQVEFNTDALIPGELYQVYVYAFDSAGNQAYQRFFLIKLNSVFIPFVEKK